jgi:hypothetical protein
MSNKNNSPEQKAAWKALRGTDKLPSRFSKRIHTRQGKSPSRRDVWRAEVAARAVEASKAAGILGRMALGIKKTMTPAAIKARQLNGLKPKRK